MPGRAQSCGSTDQLIGRRPSSEQTFIATGDQSPPGARNQVVARPVAFSSSSEVRCSSVLTAASESRRSSGWDQVWLARWWPPSAMARISEGYAAAFCPITKKVARIPYCRSRASTAGV